ncbi:MAG: hypothetical protein JXI32_01755 [Deltaproteobacteria bacterium]|nr:hypothetical protein [Deltaproteobacteria bacterium]
MNAEKRAKAKSCSETIAAACGTPLFYREQEIHVNASSRLFETDPMVAACIEILTERADISGHGLSHACKVAVDAGAIIMIERGTSAEAQRLVTLAHVAGVLHDIKRSAKDHARRGSDEAARLLTRFALTDEERAAVVGAIRNHEAFQPCTLLADPDAQLLSDALYDADKFRWGPDNFTEMLWDIADTRDIPVESLLPYFPSGLESLRRIRGTFRTTTGRRYGPGFIDLGLRIGETLYTELAKEYPPERA